MNYSPALAELVRAGQVCIERFKCPAWPELIADAGALLPVYVHCPLEVGWGQGSAYNSERKQAVDLEWLADLLAATGTPMVNTHFLPPISAFPDIPPLSVAPHHFRQVLDAALRDLEPLIHRFGAQQVIVENCMGGYGRLRLTSLPEMIGRLLEETGCGFLFDQSHARMAARQLGIDERAYVNALPMQRLRELHVTGLQVIEGRWLELLLAAGDVDGVARKMAGRTLDHFPMQPADWLELAWAMDNIHNGTWPAPWVVAFEYGGVSGFFEAITDREVLCEQVPHMAGIIHKI